MTKKQKNNRQQIKIFNNTSLYWLQEDVNNWLNKCPDVIVEECKFSSNTVVVLYHLGSDNPKYSDITHKLACIDDSLMDMGY